MSYKFASRTDIFDDIIPPLKERLRKAGFETIKDVVERGAVSLSEVTGLDPKICEGICNRASFHLTNQSMPMKTAADIERSSEKLETISTGSMDLDKLLGGQGIETRALTQFYGRSAAGKTQLCHCLSVMVQQDHAHGGLNGNACYIDTEEKFRSKRITEISKTRGLDPNEILKGIVVGKPQNVSEQELILEEVRSRIVPHNIKLVIVDSVMNHFRAEYTDLSCRPERQQRLFKFMHTLQTIAGTFHIAVIITNQVQDNFRNSILPPDPLGGNVLAHTSTYVVQLRPSGRNRTAKMMASPCHPLSDAVFTIREQGIADAEKKYYRSRSE
jgi:DNA repair protein RadA